MPKNYKFHDDDNFEESCYESEGETLYYPEKNIGSGTYAKARKFQSADGHRSLAVLKPKDKDDIDFIEVYNKYKFFKTLYPKQSIELIEREDTYRLVLPYIVGVPYEKLHLTNKRQQIKLFISAIEALKDCHNKGYIVLDLKADNIHYDMSSGKSYLLDGGISVKKDMLLDPNIFVVKTKEELISKKEIYANCTRMLVANANIGPKKHGCLRSGFDDAIYIRAISGYQSSYSIMFSPQART